MSINRLFCKKHTSPCYLTSNFLTSVKANFTLLSQSVSSVAQSCLTLCHPVNCSTPGLHHQLPEFTQTHVQGVSDAIQPSHPLLSPSPPAPNPSQHQGLFQWVNSSHEVAKVLEIQRRRRGRQRMRWLDGITDLMDVFEWTLGVGDGQGGLACCDSWGHKESDMTERLNWIELILYWCFSFWLTSLCIIGSSFIHLIRTDSNVFFLMAE